MLSHGAKVVVPEKDAKFALLGSRGELAQPVVGQLGGGGLQELLGNQACGGHKERGRALAYTPSPQKGGSPRESLSKGREVVPPSEISSLEPGCSHSFNKQLLSSHLAPTRHCTRGTNVFPKLPF